MLLCGHHTKEEMAKRFLVAMYPRHRQPQHHQQVRRQLIKVGDKLLQVCNSSLGNLLKLFLYFPIIFYIVDNDDGINIGLIVGIVGGITFVIIIIIIVVCVLKHKSKCRTHRLFKTGLMFCGFSLRYPAF